MTDRARFRGMAFPSIIDALSRAIRRLVPLAVAALVAASCGDTGGNGDGDGKNGKDGDGTETASDATPAACEVAARDVSLPADVGETSGLAASRRQPGVFWTHNDSGHGAEIYAITADGRLGATVAVAGAENRDWEDVAGGPCEGGWCLYLADIGDNAGKKDDPVALWVVPEPEPGAAQSAPARRFAARYPGKKPDAEALFVLPDGRIYVVTKGNEDPIELYRWPTPLRAGETVTLERVRELAPEPEQTGDRVTGASASPDGRWVAVRTYSALAFYRTADLLGSGTPASQMDLTPLGEGQGEAVALSDDGTVLLTSEAPGRHLPGTLSRLTCRLAQ